MPPEIIPSNTPPSVENPPTEQRDRGRALVCECCGSKVDRHGNLLRRGELAKSFLDAEDSIDKLRKSLAKTEEANAVLRTEIDALKAQIVPTAKKSLWERDA
jgi:hypothetical protein